MTTALFEELEVNTPADDAQARTTRRLALGGALQLIRTRNDWNVNDAASRAGIAPMTWRRIEDGMPVRERSHAALDRLLELPFGSVKRALADDLLMVEIVKLAGVDARHVAVDNALAFLEQFAEQMRTGSPRQMRSTGGAVKMSGSGSLTVGSPVGMPSPVSGQFVEPVVNDQILRALATAAAHVPTVKPTDLELVNRVVEQLTRSTAQTPAIRELIQAAARAVPDLIAQQLDEAERDLAAERDEDVPAGDQTAGPTS